MDFNSLKRIVTELGIAWYRAHDEEREIIIHNLETFGLDRSPSTVDAVIDNTILHYYEKFLPLTENIEGYAHYLKERIDCSAGIAQLRDSLASSRGICIAISHFGAVELITPCLASYTLPVNVVLKFSTEELSAAAQRQATIMEKTGKFSLVNIIEVGRPKTVAAMQMAAALRRQEIVLSVVDEKTPYSKPVELFGTKVWGGAGLDRMLSFANTPADLYAAFMVRESSERYHLEIHKIENTATDQISTVFTVLESVVKRHCEQWYFLHEELPFVMETAQ
jgi:lauroyl/myristoyl acyltransferase